MSNVEGEQILKQAIVRINVEGEQILKQAASSLG
jgi:hypothetical protein